MSDHLARRGSALPSQRHNQHVVVDPDPLASDWIRRLHLMPNLPPPPRPPPLTYCAPSPLLRPHQDAVSTGEFRTPPPLPQSAGFGSFRWGMQPSLGAPVGAWDAPAVSAGSAGGGGQPMLSPFFRPPAPPPLTHAADIRDVAPVSPLVRLGGNSGGYTGLSSTRMVGGGDHHASWLAARAPGAAYPSNALNMVPIRTLNDLHGRQHKHFARHDPSSSSQHDEPFSYWNMGRFRGNTMTSSISPVGVDVVPGNFGNKRNADSTSSLPLKFRKLSGAI